LAGLTYGHAMAVMESCFPGWNGLIHHDVSPGWWVIWLEFIHKWETQIIALAMLALMVIEVWEPRLLGPMQFKNFYFSPKPGDGS
jgi:hypothetical protein